MTKTRCMSTDMVGVIITTYNDIDMISDWYTSFKQSMPVNYPYGLVCVDAGSHDGSLEAMYMCEVLGPHERTLEEYDFSKLSVALNVGIRKYLGASTKTLKQKYGGKVPNLIDPFQYICWVHPDMEFLTLGWLPKLVDHLKANPDIGKLAPEVDHVRANADHDGNQCPWVMPTKVLRELELEDNTWFDEKFIGIGGLEDWDLNKRILNLGYKVRIKYDVVVKHPGMGTRAKRDTNAEAIHNRAYYTQKWGTSECPV